MTPSLSQLSICILWICRIVEHITEYQKASDTTGVCFSCLCQMFRFPLPSLQEEIIFLTQRKPIKTCWPFQATWSAWTMIDHWLYSYLEHTSVIFHLLLQSPNLHWPLLSTSLCYFILILSELVLCFHFRRFFGLLCFTYCQHHSDRNTAPFHGRIYSTVR